MDDSVQKVHELLSDLDPAELVTHSGDFTHARPLGIHGERGEVDCAIDNAVGPFSLMPRCERYPKRCVALR